MVWSSPVNRELTMAGATNNVVNPEPETIDQLTVLSPGKTVRIGRDSRGGRMGK